MKILITFAFYFCISQLATSSNAQAFCKVRYDCSAYSRYRSFDGSCNNLVKPWLGKAKSPLKRLLPAAYNDPLLVLRSKSADGVNSLPNPRSVAMAVHNSVETPGVVTLLHVFLGQILAHDFVLSPPSVNNGIKIDCATDTNNVECLNIPIPSDDVLNQDEPFIAFVRTSSINTNTDCVTTDREPFNQLTHWLDLSVLYGSDTVTSDSVRTKVDGLLKTQQLSGFKRSFMPPAPDGTCPRETTTRKCFVSGEPRPNENSVLTSVQTLLLREHNRIAEIVKQSKPNYSDEEIFQETRRFMIAQFQHIIYNDWLPLTIGRSSALSNSLLPTSTKFTAYNSSLNAALYNEFATAAFRYGHAMIKSSYNEKDVNFNKIKTVTLNSITFNPTEAYQNEGLDGFCRGAITDISKMTDSHFSDTVQNHLFEIFGPNRVTLRSSLSALNINRGRDHGLQPYVKYRELCGLPVVKSFDELIEIPAATRLNISRIYASVHDIDLFTGGISETPLANATVGPTFACIIAKQFKDFKYGDRFYYEYSLSETELSEIKKASIARIICDNLDVSAIPRNPFLPVDTINNPFVSCSQVESVSFQNLI